MDESTRAIINELTIALDRVTGEKDAVIAQRDEALRLAEARAAQAQECVETVGALVSRIETADRDVARLKDQPEYRKRHGVMAGRTVQVDVGCGPLYITVNFDDRGRAFECFFRLGKSGSCQQSYLEALGVAISVGLRYGADPQKFIDKLAGVRCPNPKMRNAQSRGALSCADGISQGLSNALSFALLPLAEPPVDVAAAEPVAMPSVAEPQPVLDLVGSQALLNRNDRGFGAGMCPWCSSNLYFAEGCATCSNHCGYSKCG